MAGDQESNLGSLNQKPTPPTCDTEWLDEIEGHFAPINIGVLSYSWMIVNDLDGSGIGAKTGTELEVKPSWPAIH